jgi:hydrogenase maturation protein HypF
VNRERARISIRGEVQGVGFRPFVYRLAREMRLGGWVRNEGADVVIEAEGEQVERFVHRLGSEHPEGARIHSLHRRHIPPLGESVLRIVPSERATARPRVVADRVTCAACLAEILDPASRYFDYPFTNCTACGPRYSILDRVPYDRGNTAMAAFSLCDGCSAEYGDPASRRFHAQPTACPACGPRLTLRGAASDALADGTAALDRAAALLADGAILALKGLGGYQLVVDAGDASAVARLRARKQRPHKPLAVMVVDVAAARRICAVREAEVELLLSPAGPITLLRSRDAALAARLHPCHAETGVMLPTTPLHHLLLRRLPRVLVCTSGNLGNEPICTEDAEALERLRGVADAFLTHDRPIRRALDDSLARVIDGAPQLLRLARGYAPLTLPLAGVGEALAIGAQQKNALALGTGDAVVVGPHIGDLASTRAIAALRAQAVELPRFFATTPRRIATDLHPDYAGSQFAAAQSLPAHAVPHHLAHALAGMAEHGQEGPLLAVVWDGAGLGVDGSIWGGEFLRVQRDGDAVHWQRLARLRPFMLPGGDAAARDPARALAGLLWEMPDLHHRIPEDLAALLRRGLNAPRCSSMGRLFDGVAAVLGHGARQSYEGMAASLLERDAGDDLPGAGIGAGLAPIPLVPGEPAVLDWAPLLRALLTGAERGEDAAALSAAFHARLAEAVAALACVQGLPVALLTGGCFQNRLLVRLCLRALRGAGIEALIPRRLPPNDGGIALGQLAALTGVHEHVPGDPRSH